MSQLGMNQSSLPDMNQPGTRLLGMKQLDVNQRSTSLADTNQLGQLGMRQPGLCQISMRQSGTWQEVLSQSGMKQTGMSQSNTSQSSTSQPGLSQLQLGLSQSIMSQLGPNQLGTSQTCMSQLGMKQPSLRQPGRSQSSMRQPSVTSFRVRPAEAQDCPEILHLIKELAACENMLDAVKLTSKDLLRDGFGDNPLFYCLIAEVQNHQKPSGKVTVGFAMYYFTYDPWIGKLLYLEDFYVIQAYRGLGIGAEMLKRLSQIAIRRQCNCMHFLVVIWNQASIDYYTRRGALDLSSEEGWHLFRFNREELMDMAGEE
ncbi:spermidine/spermine N(1)-acetyltransferase-like protein 1 [Bos javanicus]|uniref:spermidine/spermine N(1)-acetyltransferase-like protein 1 n=1 Tax=Bos javanicus TaxID=9906 RepID=UPI002AA8CA2D|nr:spermidine/spermine N(1)-acetyltransferase-like protein 1 [Bos javanicus]